MQSLRTQEIFSSFLFVTIHQVAILTSRSQHGDLWDLKVAMTPCNDRPQSTNPFIEPRLYPVTAGNVGGKVRRRLAILGRRGPVTWEAQAKDER